MRSHTRKPRLYRPVKVARDRDGSLITIGDEVRLVENEHASIGGETPPVRVLGIHRQGIDGTILTFDKAPQTKLPFHRSARACDCRKLGNE